MGKILLYYKYLSIEYPKQIAKWQKKICQDLKLAGRVLIAHEGINGTVGGETEQIEIYKKIMLEHPYFSDLDFKESYGDATYFPKLVIKVKNEVVHLGKDSHEISVKDTGTHLTPDQVHALIADQPDDLVLLDTRNNYESRIGTFKGAITPDITNFRDLPDYIDQNLEQFKDKRVLMFCTGGVRCERATAYLNVKGVAKEVMQINGGIVRYTEQYPDGFFRGKNYVFDRRVAIEINNDILSECDLCQAKCNDYVNCINALCNKHYIGCNNCVSEYHNCCSETCRDLVLEGKVPKRVPFVNAPATPPNTSCSLL